MPRAFSISIQSDTVERRPVLPCTAPASVITRACRASASVSVDFPASGWLITANVRRRAASRRTSRSWEVPVPAGASVGVEVTGPASSRGSPAMARATAQSTSRCAPGPERSPLASTRPGDRATLMDKSGGPMAIGYHDGSRSLQDQFDTRALADRIDDLLVSETISEHDRAFIEARDMFFLATADAEGRPTCSYKGGEPGFVRVVDPHTLAFPNYDGNGMYLSTGNVLVNPDVGMLFIDFEQGHRMRLEGTCEHRPRRPAARRLPGGPVRRTRARARRLPELSSIHPPLPAGEALAVRAEQRVPDPGAGVEALRLGGRRAARAGPGSRPGRARRARTLSRTAEETGANDGHRGRSAGNACVPRRRGHRSQGRRPGEGGRPVTARS